MNTIRENQIDPVRAEGAVLGAAIGDALGWPYESRARRAGGKQRPEALAFQAWIKRSGGQFRSYEEHIGPGEYSDDTQLILATGRSRLKGTNWHEHWAFSELPLWLSYERGGGGATRRSASALLGGKLPWQQKKNEDVNRFYQAGGNGVAMRVLPLCILHGGSDNWAQLASEIIANGVCTHGHPNALLGALAYGFMLWSSLRSSETLSYGQLLRECRERQSIWSLFPNIDSYWPDWNNITQHSVPDYNQQWDESRQQMLHLITKAEDALNAGALAMDEDAYASFGCFNPNVNGSGLVAAVSALYLASRYASSPIKGLRYAVQAVGSDTDTIASMTGALLGSICGKIWISDFEKGIQDRQGLKDFSKYLLLPPPVDATPISKIQKKEIESILDRLGNSNYGEYLDLPIGNASIEMHDGVQSKTKTLLARSWRATLSSGQSIFFKDLKTVKHKNESSHEMPLFNQYGHAKVPSACRVGISLQSRDISSAKMFYSEALGLPISKETQRLINFMGVLTLTRHDNGDSNTCKSKIFIEVPDLMRCFSEVQRFANSCPILQPPGTKGTHFTCIDPDGNQVDVFQQTDPSQK